MTLEQARKRREQGDLIDELVEVLEFYANSENWAKDSWGVRAVLQGYFPAVGEGGYGRPELPARAVLEKAKEHDCIPWDDAREVHG